MYTDKTRILNQLILLYVYSVRHRLTNKLFIVVTIYVEQELSTYLLTKIKYIVLPVVYGTETYI